LQTIELLANAGHGDSTASANADVVIAPRILRIINNRSVVRSVAIG
jgi:hypothetical protein